MNNYGVGVQSILKIPNIVQYCNAKHFNGYNIEMPEEDEIIGTTDKRWKNLVEGKPDLDIYRHKVDFETAGSGSFTDNYTDTTEPTFKRTGIYPSVYFNAANKNFITWAGDRTALNKTQNEVTYIYVEYIGTRGITHYGSAVPGTGIFIKESLQRYNLESGYYQHSDVKYGFSLAIIKYKNDMMETYLGGNFNNSGYKTTTGLTYSTLLPDSSYAIGNRVPMYGSGFVAGQYKIYNNYASGPLYMVMMFERFLTREEDARILSHIRSEFNL